MARKEDLQGWVVDALKHLGGNGTIVQVSKYVWDHHEKELKDSGNLFYTWQYDLRWAANRLRRKKKIRPAEDSPRGVWELV
jgi:hypothetical protein